MVECHCRMWEAAITAPSSYRFRSDWAVKPNWAPQTLHFWLMQMCTANKRLLRVWEMSITAWKLVGQNRSPDFSMETTVALFIMKKRCHSAPTLDHYFTRNSTDGDLVVLSTSLEVPYRLTDLFTCYSQVKGCEENIIKVVAKFHEKSEKFFQGVFVYVPYVLDKHSHQLATCLDPICSCAESRQPFRRVSETWASLQLFSPSKEAATENTGNGTV